MQQSRIDYRMARRATLRDVRSGLRAPEEVCDAHPGLVRAGRHIGEAVPDDCPICDDGGDLRRVIYVFSDKGRSSQSGRAVRREQLAAEVKRYGALNVYTVEVCPECRWHHLMESFWLRRSKAAGAG